MFNCLEDSALEQVDVVDEVMVLILPPAASRVGDKISLTKTEQFLIFLCVCLQLWHKEKIVRRTQKAKRKGKK